MGEANYSDITYTDDYSHIANDSYYAYDYYANSPYFVDVWSEEHILAGLSVAVIAVPGLFAYFAVVIAILRNPQTFAKKSYYTLLLSLAVCDILQSIYCLFYAVPCILFQKRIFGDSFDLYFNPIGCGLLYYVGLVSMILIAINRYIAVCRFSIYHRVFHARRTRLYLLGVWAFSAFSLMWQYFPGFGYRFYPHWYNWDYDTEAPLNLYFWYYDIAVDVVLLITLILCYASVLIKRPTKISATDANAIDIASKIKRERAERLLALQFCLISSIFVVFLIFNQLPFSSRFFSLFSMLFYTLFINCNPFIYFAFNSDIREHVLKMMGRAKNARVITVTQTARNAWD